MEMYDYIRFSHNKLGHSIRKINRTTGLDRKTIRKALDAQLPLYCSTRPREKVVIGPYVDIIKSWLIQDKRVHKKQRHTNKRIHDRLTQEYGYIGSLSTTTVTVRQLRIALDVNRKEVFIPSDPAKRDGAEMDWGELYIDFNGKRTRVYLFVLRSKYSGKVFARLYPVMKQACFLDGHIRAFAYFEGVFEKIIYDNLKTAVKKVLRGRARVEQNAFVEFRTYYNYDAQFCSICKGSEKGGVEGSVGYVRRNFLTPIPKVKCLETLNDDLLQKCFSHDLSITSGQKQTVGERFEEEKNRLMPLPKVTYRNYTLHTSVVDKFLTVRINRNRYSVPNGFRNKSTNIELGLDDVRIIHENKLIAHHKREYKQDRWVINPWHYLEALQRKPGSFSSSRILSEIEESWDPVVKKVYELQVKKYGEFDGARQFISTLLCFKDRRYEDMIAVLELSLEQKTVSKETVELIAESTGENIVSIEEAMTSHIPAIANFSIPEADVDRFDILMEVSNG